MSHICVMKNSPYFPSDAYMRCKSPFFSYRSRGDIQNSVRPRWVKELTMDWPSFYHLHFSKSVEWGVKQAGDHLLVVEEFHLMIRLDMIVCSQAAAGLRVCGRNLHRKYLERNNASYPCYSYGWWIFLCISDFVLFEIYHLLTADLHRTQSNRLILVWRYTVMFSLRSTHAVCQVKQFINQIYIYKHHYMAPLSVGQSYNYPWSNAVTL